ncbi:uncharacterized protein si:ch211-266k8.4 [Tachysurus ichikawai]
MDEGPIYLDITQFTLSTFFTPSISNFLSDEADHNGPVPLSCEEQSERSADENRTEPSGKACRHVREQEQERRDTVDAAERRPVCKIVSFTKENVVWLFCGALILGWGGVDAILHFFQY